MTRSIRPPAHLQVRYEPTIPADVRRSLKACVSRALPIVPHTLARLYIRWSTVDQHEGDAGIVARCEPLDEYHSATVTVYPLFLELDDDDRLNAVIHELCHVVLAPLMRSHQSHLSVLIHELDGDKGGPVHALVGEEHRRALESTTEALAIILQRLLLA